MSQADKRQKRLDEIIINFKKLAKELGKPNISMADCRGQSAECGIAWARLELKLKFNDLKKLAGLPVNREGASSYGKRGVHTVVKKIGGERECNKCGEYFQRTSLNRAICPKCTNVNRQHTEGGGSFFNGAEHFY